MAVDVPPDPSSADARRIQLLYRFEDAWRGGPAPALDDYLPPTDDPLRRSLLVDLVHVDLEWRLRTDPAARLERYLQRYPELAADGEALAGMLEAEHRLRRQCGEQVTPSEYQQRFPGLAPDLLARLHGAATPQPEATVGDRAVPRAAGPLPEVPGYEVLHELGRGGMGVVYRARHRRLDRPVALKMVRDPALAGEEELARFHHEAQAVAQFQHANIVQIYEVGEADGRPFFALEYVEGGGLDTLLGGVPLPARQAAQLLEVLARALEAAHQRGIIHRDLKPANVLLLPSAGPGASALGPPDRAQRFEPKLADFGLAKSLNRPQGLSLAGAVVGTPSYMAPEQALGRTELIGPAADVYGLGAILYECLTGRPPFRAETPLDTLQQVVGAEPVPPSRLNPKVPRDLETVCLKCLAKEPRKRYASAQELADDLGRFLTGQPVRARPVGRWGRAARWARRNPAVAGLLAAVALVLLAGTAVALAFAFAAERSAEAAREKEAEATEQAELARRTIEAMTSPQALAFLEKQPELRPEQRAFLEQAVAYYRQAVRGPAAGEGGAERQARAYFNMGYLQQRLGLLPEAVAAYRIALKEQSRLATDHPGVPQYRQNLAGCHGNLANVLAARGKYQEAEAAYRAALKEQLRLAAEHPGVPAYRQDLAASHHNLGILLEELGKRAEAEAAYRAALKEQLRLAAEHPGVPRYRQDLANSFNELGILLQDLGKRAQAEAAYRAALREQARLAADHPRVPEYRRDLARSHHNLGKLLVGRGKRQEAEAAYRAALKEQARLVADRPGVPKYRQELAATQTNLGALLADLGKRAEAEAAYRAVLRERARLAADHPGVPEYRQYLARSQYNLGVLLAARGKHHEAEDAYRAALREQLRLAADHPGVPVYRQHLAASHHNLGILLEELGKRAEAEAAYRAALKEQLRLAADHPGVPEYRQALATSHNNLGGLLAKLGKRAEAEAAYRAALREQLRLAADHPGVPEYRQALATSHNNLGGLLAGLGKRAEAEAAFRAALRERARLAADHPGVPEYRRALAGSHHNLGNLLVGRGKHQEAEAAYRAALRERARLAADHPQVPGFAVDLAGSYCSFGHLLKEGGKWEQTLNWYGKAITCLEATRRALGDDPTARQYLFYSHWGRAEALSRLGRYADAAPDWDRALALAPEPHKDFFRLGLADSLARAGAHARATAGAEKLIKKHGNNPIVLYNSACVYAVSARVKDKGLAERYAARAVGLLGEAVKHGYQEVVHLEKDPDLEALRGRSDYTELLQRARKSK
jgi:tetratricopeptide (TPR) repeat protein